MKKILITTTDSLFGWEIEAYLKPVFASVVIGTNAFSDFSASFTDFFGGRSGSYEKRLQLLKDNAITILTSKASELGANCILGLKVDVDEISGKSMQMFMITACGTAVIAKNTKNQTDLKHIKEIDKEHIREKANIIRLLKKFHSSEVRIAIEELQMIVESKSSEFKDFMIAKLKSLGLSNLTEDEFKQANELYKEYFASIDPSESISVLYPALLENSDEAFIKSIISIIKENDLVDYGYIHKLLNDNLTSRKTALTILQSYKPGYSFEDIALLEEVIEHVKISFPKVISVTTKKGFLSSAEKEVWLCVCNSSNSVDSQTCSNCYKDQYGFNNDELKPRHFIEALNNRLLALKSVL